MKILWRYFRSSPAPVRVGAFLMSVVAIAAPLALPIYQWEYARTAGKSVVWAPATLVLVFVLALPLWGRYGHYLQSPWATLGFVGGARWFRCWLLACLLGVGATLFLFGLYVCLGWAVPAIAPSGFVILLGEAVLIGLLVGLAEELLFRGWLLFELGQDYGPRLTLWLNALLFAIAHYLRPLEAILETWPQFLGLLLLGLTLVWARRSPLSRHSPQTSLAWPAGLHAGLVATYYVVEVGNWVEITGRVPAWVTGIGNNPLAGVAGLILLGAIATFFYRRSHT